MNQFIIIVMFALMLAGCGGTGHVMPKPVVMSQLMAAQCRVFERAFKQTKQQTGQENYSIVENCPHYKNKIISRNRFSEAGLFLKTANAAIPAHVKAQGVFGIRLYQALLAREVSVKIAHDVAKSPEFKVAINVANL